MKTQTCTNDHQAGGNIIGDVYILFNDEHYIYYHDVFIEKNMFPLVLKTYCVLSDMEAISNVFFILTKPDENKSMTENDEKNPVYTKYPEGDMVDIDPSLMWYLNIRYKDMSSEEEIHECISADDLVSTVKDVWHKDIIIGFRIVMPHEMFERGSNDEPHHTKQTLVALPIYSTILKSSIEEDTYYITDSDKDYIYTT